MLPWIAPLLPLITLAVYLRAARAVRGWPMGKILAFAVGAAIVALALSPPVALWAQADPRGHMLRHVMLGMLAPLALVLATPLTLWLCRAPGTVALRSIERLDCRPARLLLHPAVAALLFVGGQALLFLTPLHALAREHAPLQGVVLLMVLIAGLLYAESIAGDDPLPRRPSAHLRLFVLFAATLATGALGRLMFEHGQPQLAGESAEVVRLAAKIFFHGADLAALQLAVAFFAGSARAARVDTPERAPRPPQARPIPAALR